MLKNYLALLMLSNRWPGMFLSGGIPGLLFVFGPTGDKSGNIETLATFINKH